MAQLYEYHSMIGIASPYRNATLKVSVEDDTLLVEHALTLTEGVWVYSLAIDEPDDIELAHIAMDMLEEDRHDEYLLATKEICIAIAGCVPDLRPTPITDRRCGLLSPWIRPRNFASSHIWYSEAKIDGRVDGQWWLNNNAVGDITSLSHHRAVPCNEISVTLGASQPRLIVLGARAYLTSDLDEEHQGTVTHAILGGDRSRRHRR